jgi:hypothetical protein
MTEYYKEKLEQGLEFQDFVTELGMFISRCLRKVMQIM